MAHICVNALASVITTMAARFDIVVYGASGFTGAWIARRLAEAVSRGAISSYALGGRSVSKLEAVATTLRERGLPSPSALLVADAGDEAALRALAARARLCIAAVGPFRLHGAACAAACVAEHTDYLDICGEPYFLESCAMRLHAAAKAAKVLLLGAAAFDCVPAELGVAAAAGALNDTGSLPVAVHGYLSLASTRRLVGHFATYESAVLGFGGANELAALRHEAGARAATVYGGKLVGTADVESIRGNGLLPFFWSREARGWALPFPGADASVVRRTQRALEARGATAGAPPPVAFAAYVTLPTSAALLRMLAYGAAFALLARWSWGRNLLLAYPHIFSGGAFSHKGPSSEEIAAASFAYRFVAVGHAACEADAVRSQPRRRGSPAAAATIPLPPARERAVVEVRGPEPGYDATSSIVVAVATALLRHRSSLPEVGGVHTFGALFTYGSPAYAYLLAELAVGGVHVATVEPAHTAGTGTAIGERRGLLSTVDASNQHNT